MRQPQFPAAVLFLKDVGEASSGNQRLTVGQTNLRSLDTDRHRDIVLIFDADGLETDLFDCVGSLNDVVDELLPRQAFSTRLKVNEVLVEDGV